ncbi:MAG: response regulator transcription factor [Candidatus Promineifilaceae bacterium]
MARTIMVVDDDAAIRQMLRVNLEQEGFRIVTASNGREALFVLRQEKPDLIILDLMMPEMGGYEFMRAYSQESDTPVIMLTAKIDETDKVLGLEFGADDYLTKPFSMRELIARIRALLRRIDKLTGRSAETPPIRLGPIMLDMDARLVMINDERVNLTPSEFDILALLMNSPNKVFSRLDLMEQLQGVALEGYERSIDVHIRNLRVKIEPDPSQPRYIETVYGMGYRFSAE